MSDQSPKSFQSREELQALLRFLCQDGKLPLGQAMGKVTDFGEAGLTSPTAIAQANLEKISSLIPDQKIAKQIHNAAKRANKKRSSAPDSSNPSSKRPRASSADPLSPAAMEESLELPEICTDEAELASAVLHTNRAPLVLAFAVTLLKFTMPEQPISSRLSLAQAVVSANSKSKAVSLGLEKESTAKEEEKAAEGQPTITILGREVRVMKRWGYEWKKSSDQVPKSQDDDALPPETDSAEQSDQPALWGVDMDALRKKNAPVTSGNQSTHPNPSQLPIHHPQGARAYLLKSFESVGPNSSSKKEPTKQTNKSRASQDAIKSHNLALLLGALELLFVSWSDSLSNSELDRRTWSWYAQVRPEVETGIAGWGGKGDVKLSNILSLRKPKLSPS